MAALVAFWAVVGWVCLARGSGSVLGAARKRRGINTGVPSITPTIDVRGDGSYILRLGAGIAT